MDLLLTSLLPLTVLSSHLPFGKKGVKKRTKYAIFRPSRMKSSTQEKRAICKENESNTHDASMRQFLPIFTKDFYPFSDMYAISWVNLHRRMKNPYDGRTRAVLNILPTRQSELKSTLSSSLSRYIQHAAWHGLHTTKTQASRTTHPMDDVVPRSSSGAAAIRRHLISSSNRNAREPYDPFPLPQPNAPRLLHYAPIARDAISIHKNPGQPLII